MKSNNMQHQKMAEAQWWQGRRAEKDCCWAAAGNDCSGAQQKHVGRWQEKIAAGAKRQLALSSARASMLLGSKLRGGRLAQQ